ncbi:hypothetical protein PCURB6_30130 [Paenibacillus curdlanolyticus]|nr:hypothetical protein PCURB6_30130 [Paenibacillus curdlanolyticus]
MAWLYLIFGGILEVVWAYGLQESDGFTRLWPSVLTVAALIASFTLFAKSMKMIEIGTAYAVFTGLGTAGTVLFGMLWLGDPVQFGKLFFVTLLLCGIIGLKLIAKDEPAQQPAVSGLTDVGIDRSESTEAQAVQQGKEAEPSARMSEQEVR